MPSRVRGCFCVSASGGAVGTIIVVARNALRLVQPFFIPKTQNPDFPEGKLRYGWFKEDDEVIAEVLLCRWERHPRWGCGCVEVHLHGGCAVVERVAETLKKRGLKQVSTNDLLKMLERRGFISPLQREAEEVLLGDCGERGVVVAGNWRRLERLIEEIAGLPRQKAIQKLQVLLETAGCGLIAANPPHILIAGPPNAGKSSLLNALIRQSRCIVHPEPGTTVDVITVRLEVDGYRLFVSDTAGVCEEEGLWEAAMKRLRQEAQRCDLILWLHDTSRPPTKHDIAVQNIFKGKEQIAPLGLDPARIVPIISKADKEAVWLPEVAFCATSARRKTGIDRLKEVMLRFATVLSCCRQRGRKGAVRAREMVSAYNGWTPRWRLPTLFTQRQVKLCSRALSAYVQGDTERARQLLAKVVGEKR
ncbi:MAG: hypothetical protein DRP63_05040 [Planctomycetota bacterium]|nr:MAG: hypothetical protein DRP63_05040 [Planctomycetota bacterium]